MPKFIVLLSRWPTYRYHTSANLILSTGIIVGVVSHALGWFGSPWIGFMAGAVPAFVLATVAIAVAEFRAVDVPEEPEDKDSEDRG